MVSHKSLKLSSLFFILFLLFSSSSFFFSSSSERMTSSALYLIHWSFLSTWYYLLNPSIEFSIHLLYEFALWFVTFLYFPCICWNSILFIHCLPDFGEHLYDHFWALYQVNHSSEFYETHFWSVSCSFVWNIFLFLHIWGCSSSHFYLTLWLI